MAGSEAEFTLDATLAQGADPISHAKVLSTGSHEIPKLPGYTLQSRLGAGASGRSDQVWSWLGAGRRAQLEQVLWCGNLAQLLELEMDLPSAARWAALPVRDPGLRAQAEAVEKLLLEGSSLGQAIHKNGWDPLISWAASAGEQHQTLAGALQEAANTLEASLEEDISQTLAWLQPAALALVGGLMLVTLASFWLDYQTISLEAVR